MGKGHTCMIMGAAIPVFLKKGSFRERGNWYLKMGVIMMETLTKIRNMVRGN